jgi:hypothetical protein
MGETKQDGQIVRLSYMLREFLACYAPENDDLDRLAERFRAETGLLAPGKDPPPTTAESDADREKRVLRWREWVAAREATLLRRARLTLELDGTAFCESETDGSGFRWCHVAPRCTLPLFHQPRTHIDELFECEWEPEPDSMP